jgi:hypothetical protein
LLLTPNADHLFDRGVIGLEDNGNLLISQGQRRYLEFHRENVNDQQRRATQSPAHPLLIIAGAGSGSRGKIPAWRSIRSGRLRGM